MNEERIQLFSDLLLIGKIQSAFEWDPKRMLKKKSKTTAIFSPDSFQMHGPNLHHMSHFLTLQDTVSPAPSHSSNVEELGAVDHVVI